MPPMTNIFLFHFLSTCKKLERTLGAVYLLVFYRRYFASALHRIPTLEWLENLLLLNIRPICSRKVAQSIYINIQYVKIWSADDFCDSLPKWKLCQKKWIESQCNRFSQSMLFYFSYVNSWTGLEVMASNFLCCVTFHVSTCCNASLLLFRWRHFQYSHCLAMSR